MILVGLVIYILIAWFLKKLVWNRANNLESLKRRLFWKSFYVALIATPTLTLTLPFVVPVPAITMLVSGLVLALIETEYFYFHMHRALFSGLLPIAVFAFINFGIALIFVSIKKK